MTSLIPVFIGLIFMATMLTAQGKKNREEYYKQSIHCLRRQLICQRNPGSKNIRSERGSFKRLYTSIIVMKDSVLKMTMGYRNKMSMFERLRVRRRFFLFRLLCLLLQREKIRMKLSLIRSYTF